MFRNALSETIFEQKYAHKGAETWDELSRVLAFSVCSPYLPVDTVEAIYEAIRDMKFIPGGRYLYYAGRQVKFYNNCYLLKAEEDSREDWATLSWKAESCLLTGGGIGADYSIYRDSNSTIGRTGGRASGPIPKMQMVNEIGRHIMQGGSRRSAIYASLNHKHGDIHKFLHAKDWSAQPAGTSGLTIADLKQQDFNFPAPLDMTNISVNYDTEWLLKSYNGDVGDVFIENVRQALRTGEPGFSFNFFDREHETLRNACTEVVSSDDSDVCNLGSLNLSRISTLSEFTTLVELGTLFLLCGTLESDLPYGKVHEVRNKNRRLGLGLMGIHEWLIQRGWNYNSGNPELHKWLSVYKGVSDATSQKGSDRLEISRPVANRAIAPTGTIGLVAGTTTGIEPVYAVAYKRRYLKGTRWHYQYAVDHAAQTIINETGCNPDDIESAIDLAMDYERRIKFQADVQDYVDMSISSTINLPSFGSDWNNEDTVRPFSETLSRYASRLRGFTCYPDGARGGQPLSSVPYKDAVRELGNEYLEVNDVCDITGGGYCGL